MDTKFRKIMGNSGTEVHPAWLAKSCSKHRRIGFRL